jgi:hypothetical protein
MPYHRIQDKEKEATKQEKTPHTDRKLREYLLLIHVPQHQQMKSCHHVQAPWEDTHQYNQAVIIVLEER